ncbi:MAG: hypothetical protein JXQ73_11590 [Phycisphaerae bacterium]|nr:hypothetical protein [Phycisphaerae bacterium]
MWRALAKLIFMGCFAWTLDGFLCHDPNVGLPHGYRIIATSWSRPCLLMYSPAEDPRPHSDWWARYYLEQDQSGGKSESFLLVNNDAADEPLEFSSEAEWRAAIKERNAVPEMGRVQAVTGITEFAERGPFVFGNCDQGYFLLDTDDDDYAIMPKEDWVRQVTAKTGSPPGEMKNPKSYLLQHRGTAHLCVVGGTVAFALTWALVPLWRPRRERHQATA